MKKFTVPCYFNGVKAPFTIYIGAPEDQHHPLHFQADWLQKERGGTIPSEVMDSIAKLKALADKNNVSFEDLCVYALGAAQQDDDTESSSSNTIRQEDSPSAPIATVNLAEETTEKADSEEELQYETEIEETIAYPTLASALIDDSDEDDSVKEIEVAPKKVRRKKKDDTESEN